MSGSSLPTTIVIFGASGDLTWRKLIPALYNNFKKGRLSDCARIVGYARRSIPDDAFRDHLREGITTFSPDTFEASVWESFAQLLHYFQGNLDVAEDYVRLSGFLKKLENGPANRMYYLATAPEHYALAVGYLGAAGMTAQDDGWRRIVIEKPFGEGLASAQTLNRAVHTVFDGFLRCEFHP